VDRQQHRQHHIDKRQLQGKIFHVLRTLPYNQRQNVSSMSQTGTVCCRFKLPDRFQTLVSFIFTLMPLFSTLSFHSLSLLIRSYSVSAIKTWSSAYNNSLGKTTLNSLDKAYMTITNSKGLNAEPWCILSFTQKPLMLPKTVLQ